MKKRIAQFIDTTDPGGAENMVLELSKVLQTRGYEPVLLHFNSPFLQPKCRDADIETFLQKLSLELEFPSV